MRCSNGHENEQQARFCGVCGQVLTQNTTAFPNNGSTGVIPPQTSATVSIQALRSSLINDLQSSRFHGFPIEFHSVLSMMSGVLFAIAAGLLALNAVAESDSDSPYAPGFFWATVGCVAVYLIAKFIGPKMIVGATTAFVVLAGLSVLLLFGSSIEDGEIGLALIILGLVYGIAWVMPILRARPALLASALVSFGTGIVVAIMQSAISDAVRCGGDEYSNYSDCLDDPTEFLTSVSQKSSTLFLIIGIVLLVVAWTLDRKDWPSLGRVFIGVGIFFEISGAFGVWQSSGDRTAASILLVIAGALLLLVAVQRSRTTSLLIGAVGAIIGIVSFVSAITSSNESSTGFIILTLLASIGIGILCVKQSSKIQSILQSVGQSQP